MSDGALGGAAAVVPHHDRSDSPAVVRDLPAFLNRARQLLRLAELAGTGPDPEALLPDIEELRRHCDAFVRVHR